MASEYPEWYYEGYDARKRRKNRHLGKDSCPYNGAAYSSPYSDKDVSAYCKRHWWLAGWNQADMDCGKSVISDRAIEKIKPAKRKNPKKKINIANTEKLFSGIGCY